jgi:hypothetical protein
MNLVGHWHDVLAVQRLALRAAAHSGDPTGQAHAHLALGRAQSRLGNLGDAACTLVGITGYQQPRVAAVYATLLAASGDETALRRAAGIRAEALLRRDGCTIGWCAKCGAPRAAAGPVEGRGCVPWVGSMTSGLPSPMRCRHRGTPRLTRWCRTAMWPPQCCRPQSSIVPFADVRAGGTGGGAPGCPRPGCLAWPAGLLGQGREDVSQRRAHGRGVLQPGGVPDPRQHGQVGPQ